MTSNGAPERAAFDGNEASLAGRQAVNTALTLSGGSTIMAVQQKSYLGKTPVQIRRFITRIARRIMSLRSPYSAAITSANSEIAHLTRKRPDRRRRPGVLADFRGAGRVSPSAGPASAHAKNAGTDVQTACHRIAAAISCEPVPTLSTEARSRKRVGHAGTPKCTGMTADYWAASCLCRV